MAITVNITADNGNFVGRLETLESDAEWQGAILEQGEVYIDIDGELHEA